MSRRAFAADVSPRLLDIYAGDGLTLDQLMAFTVSDDHARQEQAFDSLSHSYEKQPHAIRRMLTQHAVQASDKRYVGTGAEREFLFLAVNPVLEPPTFAPAGLDRQEQTTGVWPLIWSRFFLVAPELRWTILDGDIRIYDAILLFL
mgnify:FL=1